MNETTNIAILLFIITNLILYVIGMIALVKSAFKYKYNFLWVFVGVLLFVCPPLLIVLMASCERGILIKSRNAQERAKGKCKLAIVLALFVCYYLLFPAFSLILRYTATNADWYAEIALVCVNVVMIAFIPLYLFVKRTLNKYQCS